MGKHTPEEDKATIAAALTRAALSHDDIDPVLQIVAGQVITVTMQGWQWVAVTSGLQRRS